MLRLLSRLITSGTAGSCEIEAGLQYRILLLLLLLLGAVTGPLLVTIVEQASWRALGIRAHTHTLLDVSLSSNPLL